MLTEPFYYYFTSLEFFFLNEDQPETCCGGPVEEDGVGCDDQQHGRVRGDVVRDGVLEALFATATTAPDFFRDRQRALRFGSRGGGRAPGSRSCRAGTAGAALLGDGRVVEHGHAFHAQQHSQTPRNHVVEDDGAVGEEES